MSGNLLIALFSHDGGNGGGQVEFPETDWTKFFEVSNGSANTLAFAYRWADGLEGATISVETQNAEKSSHLAYRLSGAVNPSSQAPEASTGATGASATPDPDSLTPAGGAKDFLWLAVAGNDGNTEPSAYPTNYTDGFSAKASSPATCGVGSAQRSLNASSENPGTFTIGFSEQWVAAVIAVHPA